MISFAIQGELSTASQWIDLARSAEAMGFEALSIADHPGSTAAPFVALAAAAQVTTRLLLAPAVVNAGAWEPLALAAEVATLDVLSEGRALLGIGAGHTPSEWTQRGQAYPSAIQRIENLEAVLLAVRGLLAGEVVTSQGATWRLEEATLRWRPSDRPQVPILVGGNARALVQVAARQADVLELTGLGRTLADGHAHEAQWSASQVDARVRLATASGHRIRLGALVQKVETTDDRRSAAESYRRRLGTVLDETLLPSVEDLLDTPFVLFGTDQEIVSQLRRNLERWGISRYTIKAADIFQMGGIMELLCNPDGSSV